MLFKNRSDGFTLEGKQYSIIYENSKPFAFVLRVEGKPFFKLPIVSGLATLNEEEQIGNINIVEIKEDVGGYKIMVTATSSIWEERRFTWIFSEDCIEYYHEAYGKGAPGKCYFFSNGISDFWSDGKSQGVDFNTTIYVPKVFNPAVNHGNTHEFTISVPQSVGIGRDSPVLAYGPHQLEGLFAPPPLMLSFGDDECDLWCGLGIGTEPGKYLFNSFEFTGSLYAGASFYVNYLGYLSIEDHFSSPVISLHFGYSPFETMEKYVDWIDRNKYGTQKAYKNPDWHRMPVFCGWAEQTFQAHLKKCPASMLATQSNYESWIDILEKRNLPVGTIVIDDKWQKYYGTFEVDENKWPDLKGFVERQHKKGRHVLLWVPGYHKEGIPEELCVKDNYGNAICADVTNPAYEEFLRKQIRYLVKDIGIDGFKEDWIGSITSQPGCKMYKNMHGIEFIRRFQYILYDETHKNKEDAMIETQTPNPLFRESSDVLRLNDIWYGTRDVEKVMRIRARISRIAGWEVLDCDNASSTNLYEWWNYMLAQPYIGVPSLYFVSHLESSFEVPSEAQWQYLSYIWQNYIKEHVNQVK